MIDSIPPHDQRVIVDNNYDYLMFVDKSTITTEEFIIDDEPKSYKSAWVYVTYHQPYAPYVLNDEPSIPIKINKYKTVIDCQNYQNVIYEMYNYDVNGNLILSNKDYQHKQIPSTDFRPIHENTIGDIQANIICKN